MQISTLRKIYPFLNKNVKNIKWRALTDAEINAAMKEPQKVANCYNVASRYALFSSDKGRELLRQRIRIQKNAKSDPAYKFTLSVNNKDEIYRVDDRDYFRKFFGLYKNYNADDYGNFSPSECGNLNLAADIAVSKMISKYPKQKELALRFFKWPYIRNLKCEYNRPSRAFEWFTGIKPKNIGEDGLFKALKNQPENVRKFLQELGQSKDYSLIVMSGNKGYQGIKSWHCLPVTNIDSLAEIVSVINRRNGKQYKFSFDEIIKNFKALVGIKWE